MYYKLFLVSFLVLFQMLWAHPNGTSFLQVDQEASLLSVYLSVNKNDVLEAIGLQKKQEDTLQQVGAYASQRLQLSLNDNLSYIDWDSIFLDTGKIYSLYGTLPFADSIVLVVNPSFFVELDIVSICHMIIKRNDTLLYEDYYTDQEEARFELFHPSHFYLKSKKEKRASWLSFVWIGFKHILPFGLDHILFVIGLFLFSRRWRVLSMQTLTFTVAHSIALALVLLNFLSLSSNIVEPLIALSIVFIVFENLCLKTQMKYRLIVVFLFGLLHGMGFAFVLENLRVDSSLFLMSLISFNVGLELGQIVIVLSMLLLTYSIYKKSYYHKVILVPLNLIIGSMGLYWLIDRLV